MESKNQLIRCNTSGGLILTSVEDMWRTATMFAKSGLCPAALDTPEKVVVTLQAGAELGLKPWQALNSIHVIKGKVSLSGSMMIGLVRNSDKCSSLRMSFTGTPGKPDFAAVVTSIRVGEDDPCVTEFSVRDATLAGLWDKGENWRKYPRDMLTWRAVSRHCRLYYSDVISGFYTPDEVANIPAETFEEAQIEAEETISEQAGSETVVADFEPEASVEEYEKNMEENITPEDEPIDEGFLTDKKK